MQATLPMPLAAVQMDQFDIQPMGMDAMSDEVAKPHLLFKQVLRDKARQLREAAVLQLSSRAAVIWQPPVRPALDRASKGLVSVAGTSTPAFRPSHASFMGLRDGQLI